MEADLSKRHQTMIILWFALLMSIGSYFLFLQLAAVPELSQEPGNQSRTLFVVGLTALGTLFVLLSFPVKRRFLRRSIDQQDINSVQRGLIIACAMCEVSALLGVFERLVLGSREYYLLFLVAAAGTAAHFPKRSQLEAASYKMKDPWK